MTPQSTMPVCLAHPELPGQPCTRCGTFRCSECLRGGLCPACSEFAGTLATAPTAETVVGFGRRAVGRLLDLAAFQLVSFVGQVSAFLFLWGVHDQSVAESVDHHSFAFNLLIGNAAFILGVAVSTWVCGATLGKVVLGLRVVGLDGDRPSAASVWKRELAFVIDSLFFGLVSKSVMDGSELRQRGGDSWGKTTVMRKQFVGGRALASPFALVAGIGAGAITSFFSIFIGYVLAA